MTVSLVFILAGLCTGFIAGFLGGLLGIGGGIVIVPALMLLFELQEIKGPTTALAVGTSLATIVFTSTSAARAQIKRGAVCWDIVRIWAPFVLMGSFASGFAADYSPDRVLKGFIGCFLLMVAIVMLRNWQPDSHRRLPGIAVNALMALTVGFVSGLVGIGGGNITVPILSYFNVKIQNAVATASTLGVPIALFGAGGFTLAGWSSPNLPTGSLGYLYLPAVIAIATASILTAPLGVSMAHRLPAGVIKRVFGIVLTLVSLRMLISAI